MYYLLIKNLGVEKCIDKNTEDIYSNNQSYNCNTDLDFKKKVVLKEIKIKCIEFPDIEISATVCSD